MRAREEGRRAGGRGEGKKHRNEERRRRVPHQQGRGRARVRGARREGDTVRSHGTTARSTTRGRGGERERRTKRGGTTHHGTTAHTAPPRTHTNTQTPHRHHAHHTHPHPAARPTDRRHTHTHRPAPTASERRALATHLAGGQPGEGERLTQVAARNSAGHPPSGMPSCHPHSAQRRLARAHAVEPVPASHAHTTCAQKTQATGPGCPPPGTGGRGRESA